jgi:single-stranded-DNA-specific exonuclease
MLEGMAFGKARLLSKLKRKNLILKVAFTPQINNFQGPSLQLLIREIMTEDETTIK